MTDSTIDARLHLHPYARYRLEPRVLDRLPLGTFLISAGNPGAGSLPEAAMRLVKPNAPQRYPAPKLTPEGRLLYYFWSHRTGGKRALGMASTAKTWRWIVQPGEPGYEELDAFKIACDHRRDKPVSLGLLYKALGLELT
jgi:hypothetical protein